MADSLIIERPDAGLRFVWNRAHTVNVQWLDNPGTDIDVMSIGSFADDSATLAEFDAAVSSYEREA